MFPYGIMRKTEVAYLKPRRDDFSNVVDPITNHRVPYVRRIQTFSTTFFVEVHNLPIISHLDLAETYYKMGPGFTAANAPLFDQLQSVFRLFRNQTRTTVSRVFYDDFIQKENERVPLRFIRGFLRYCRLERLCENRPFAVDLFSRILLQVQRFHNDDGHEIISDFLTTVCKTREMKVFLTSPSISLDRFEYMLLTCNRARFDIRTFMTVHEFGNHFINGVNFFCPVLDCMFQGKISRLKKLLRHGFEGRPLEFISVFSMFTGNVNLEETESIIRFTLLTTIACASIRQSLPLLLHTFYPLFRRYCAMLRGEGAHPEQPNWIECATLFCRSVPNPYISVIDLIRLLRSPGRSTWEELQPFTSSMIDLYQTEFREIATVYGEPRSLKHLCRCVIRERLRDNFQLPNGVYSLRLPGQMHSYLLLDR